MRAKLTERGKPPDVDAENGYCEVKFPRQKQKTTYVNNDRPTIRKPLRSAPPLQGSRSGCCSVRITEPGEARFWGLSALPLGGVAEYKSLRSLPFLCNSYCKIARKLA